MQGFDATEYQARVAGLQAAMAAEASMPCC